MRKLFLIFAFLFLFGISIQAEETSDQQFVDFNIAGYGEGGKKTWTIEGQSADIFENVVKLSNIKADVFGQEEQMVLTAKKGSLDKQSGNMHLEQDVVATTQTGAKMTTDSLDWQRGTNLVTTPDKVKIEKENMTAVGTGAEAKLNLNLAKMEKDVTVNINTEPKNPQGNITTITCDGPLNVDYQNEIGVFRNNVVATDAQGKIYADMMRIYFDFKAKGIKKIICVGNVKIIKGESTSYSKQAIYSAKDKKLILIGKPKLILLTEGANNNAPFGN
ncbi:MAG: LPS export ABC transporter periplasmic protein LptC [Candidatus Omnitrophota bacterium]|nr:LPS export ABC transporter periplasmic protein LptC [Candidatus Omnitrophota bacterium]